MAILGGGVGSMTAAYYLSDQPGWQSNYDITVYQQGWRLGGKGASGRNAAFGQRIEEHGLHIWFGFYANAFKMIKAAYASPLRPAGAFKSWRDAFKQHDYIALSEDVNGEYKLDGRKTLCNVGSVGQPRDGNWRSCYVVLDGETIKFRRVEYDVEKTIKKIYDIPELENFLGDRLWEGR